MISFTLLLALSVAPIAVPAACPDELTFESALYRVDSLPIVQGYSSAYKTSLSATNHISSLHGTTQLSLSPGFRLWPQDQVHPEGSINASHTFRMALLGQARQRVAKTQLKVLHQQAQAQRIARQLATAQIWIQKWSADAQLQLSIQQEKSAETLFKRIQKGVLLGEHHLLSQYQAEAERVRAHLAVIDAQGFVEEAGLALSEQIGCPTSKVQAVVGAPWQVNNYDKDRQSKPLSARQQAILTSQQATKEALHLVELNQRPLIGIGMSAEVDAKNTLRSLATLSASWNLFGGNYLTRSSHATKLALLTAQKKQISLDEMHLMQQLIHEIEHQEENLIIIEKELLPHLENIVLLHHQALSLGEGNALELIRAEISRTQTQRHAQNIRTLLALTVAQSRLWAKGMPPHSPSASSFSKKELP